MNTKLVLGILIVLIIIAGGFYYLSKFATPTKETETAAPHVVATYQQYSLVLKSTSQGQGAKDEPWGVTGKLVLTNNTGKEFTLENSYTDDLPVILYVDDSETYAELSIGTSFARSIEIYRLTGTPVKIAEFCAQHNAQFWGSHYAIYLDCENQGVPRPWEIGAPNITAINLETEATSTLVASNPLSTYMIPIITGGTMNYEVDSVASTSAWTTDNGQYLNTRPLVSTTTVTVDIVNALRSAGIY